MPDLPKTGIEYVAETSKAERNIADLIGDLTRLERQFNDAAAESKDLDRALGSIDDSVDIKVDIDTSDVSELNEVENKLDSLVALQTIDLAMNIGGTALDFLNRFERFTGLSAIMEMDTAIAKLDAATGSAIPNAEELITNLWLNGWGESRTQLAEVIQQAHNLGISQGELYEASESALEIQSIWGKDTLETMRAADSMVKNNLAPDIETAMDIIATGLQTGADRGDDLLDTFNEYGSTFKQLRIDGPDALGLINSGLAAGVDNSDRIADALRETGIRLNEMATNPAIQEAFTQLDQLTSIDLSANFDAWQAGEMSGGEFFESFFQAIEDANAADPTKASTLAATLVGTIAEDFGIESISQLTPKWDETMGVLDDRADIAGATISDTLQTQIETFFRWVEQQAINFLSSEQIDLPGKIEDIKTGLTNAMAALSQGEGLAEALEIGLAIPGFADSVHRFEASVGEFLISVLELVAGVQDFLGRDSSGTRAQVAGLAENQLAYNLQVANPDEFAGEIQRATERGVSSEAINEAIQIAVGDLIDEGDVERAQQIADSVKEAADYAREHFDPGEAMRRGSATDPIMLVDTGAINEQIAAANMWGDAFAQIQQSADNDSFISNMLGNARASQTFVEAADEANAVVSALPEFGNISDQLGLDETAVSEQESLWDRVNSAVQQTMSTDVPQAVDAGATAVEEADNRIAMAMTGNTMTASFETVATVADTTMKQMQAIVEMSITKMVAAEVVFTNQTNILKGALLGLLGEVGPGIINLSTNLQNIASGASVAAQTITAANAASRAATIEENAEGGQFSGLSWVGEGGPELISSDKTLSVLNNRTSDAFMTGFNMAAMQGGIQTTNNYITINQSNNLASGAALGNQRFSVGRQIRGL